MALVKLALYKKVFRDLLPPGEACKGENLQKLVESFAPETERIDDMAASLFADTDPRTTENFISEWETTLGLPDPDIIPQPSTLQARRIAVLSRLTALGGQTAAYLTGLASNAGFDIRIVEGIQFLADISEAGDFVGGDPSSFIFYVYLLHMDDGLSTSLLENIINRYKPAHLVAVYSYRDILFRAGDRAGQRLVRL